MKRFIFLVVEENLILDNKINGLDTVQILNGVWETLDLSEFQLIRKKEN